MKTAGSWRRHPVMAVVGSIDSNGAITAKPFNNSVGHHDSDTCSGKRWRFLVQRQEFIHVGPRAAQELTDEENFAVWDYLVKKGYTDDETRPEPYSDD